MPEPIIDKLNQLKVTDKNGNVYVLLPVDTEARQEIDSAELIQFDDDYFTAKQENGEVNIGLKGVPFGVESDTPLQITQDTPEGIVLASDAPFAEALCSKYDPESTYLKDEFVIQLGKVYRAKADIPTAEAWTPAHWNETSVFEQIGNVEALLAAL